MTESSYHRLHNYSTTVPVERTIARIEKLLAAQKASRIVKDYDEEGSVSGLTFAIKTDTGELPIQLPCNIAAVQEVFKQQAEDRKLPWKYSEGEWARKQAGRVGWRNLQDWLEAQLALMACGLVQMEQIFLPYMYDVKTGQTLFEMFEESNFKMLSMGKESRR